METWSARNFSLVRGYNMYLVLFKNVLLQVSSFLECKSQVLGAQVEISEGLYKYIMFGRKEAESWAKQFVAREIEVRPDTHRKIIPDA